MRFETLILLIILFNIVTAVLKKRAQKARQARQAEESRAGSAGEAPRAEPYWPEAETPGAWEEEWQDAADHPDVLREQSRDRAPEPVRITREERAPGRDHRSGAEDHRRARLDETRRVREEVRNVAAEEETRRHDERKGRLADAGHDLLERIARDLGVETHREAGRRGEPSKTASRRKMERRPVIGSFERIVPAAPVRPTTPVDGAEAGARARPFRVDLSGTGKLREAVVLKEILDGPLARRPRRPGNGPPLIG